ncbi:MAG: OmpA family protein [Mariprofundaceae bacterium]|nr:OmpA family protein [Mariprofundaceae bacterium]
MKKHLWVLCLLVFLPGCLSQTHYDELMGMSDDVKAVKENDKKQDQRIDRMEEVLHQLQSGLRPEIQDSGVKVEPVKTSRVETEAIEAVKVTMPQSVLFASGSTRINAAGRSVLARIAEGLKSAPEEGLIRIVGHSDARPVSGKLRSHFTDNWELSAARAAAVARVFIWGESINENRIRVEGRAAVEPVADDTVATGRAQNRRIEIFVEKNS